MQESEKLAYKFLCKIDTSKKENQSTIVFLNKYFDELLPCFYPMSTKVHNKTFVELKGMVERSILIVTPTKFTVDFKDEFANINVLR